MAFIEKREGPRGRKYRVRVRDPITGELVSETFHRKADAEDWLHSIEAAKRGGTYRDRRAGKEPLGTFVESFITGGVDLSAGTRALYRTMADRYVTQDIGRRPIAAIRPRDVRQWISNLVASGVGVPTVTVARRLVARVLSQAVADGILASNPADHAPPPRSERRALTALSPADVQAIAEAIDPRYRALVLTQAYCALRFGEASALRRRDLDLLRGRLTVARALTEVRGIVSEGPTKTAGSVRVVAMPAMVRDALAEHLSLYPDSDLVFTAPDGGFIRRTNWRRRVWAPALAKAGLRGIRPHDLRHFGAAVAIAAGAHPKHVQARLGHGSIRTTLDVYGSLFPGVDEELAGRLDTMAEDAQKGRAADVVALRK